MPFVLKYGNNIPQCLLPFYCNSPLLESVGRLPKKLIGTYCLILDGSDLTRISVQKYGGTSVGGLVQLEMVAERISMSLNSCDRVLVVVSAMGGFTDELLAMANTIHSNPPKRELDMLVTTGERISAALLGISLNKLGISAISLTGSQCGILTDETHGNARIQKIKDDRLKNCLEDYEVVIVAGFQGVSPATKDITSLGRGGSDLTAVALAIALKAEYCEINTDVKGVFTSDPRFVSQAKLIAKLTWDEMTNMSWKGAGVLHHRAAFLAKKYKLPVIIRSSKEKTDKKTLIEGNKVVEESFVTAITSKKNQVLLEFVDNSSNSLDQGTRVLDLVRAYLWNYDESPLIFQTSFRGGLTHVLLVFSKTHIDSLLVELNSKGIKLEVAIREDVVSISVIGGGFRQNPELVNSAFSCLQKPIYFSDTNDTSMTFILHPKHLETNLKTLHQQLLVSQ